MIKRLCAALAILAMMPFPASAAQTIDEIASRSYDLDSHSVLYARNANTFMESASNTKLLSYGTSLALLGPDFRWTTPVYRTGPVDPLGTLHGDVVLVASGDPNLSQRIQPDGTLAFENVDHADGGSRDARAVPGDPLLVFDGRVAVDDSLFTVQGVGSWSTLLSPIVVNDNLVDISVTAGAKVGDPTSIAVSPQTAYVKFINNMATGPAGTEYSLTSADVRNADGSHTVTLKGSIPPALTMLDNYAVPEPRVFAEMAFAMALKDAGVTSDTPANAAPFSHEVAAAAYTDANRIAQHVSPPLSEDTRVTLKVSQNLHAALEPVMWGVYVAHAKNDWLKAGFAQEHALLQRAGLNLDTAAQQDGDGAFGFFTPDFLVRYLGWVSTQSWFPTFRRGLPILGVDGTLYEFQRNSPAKGRVFAKTGTDQYQDLLNNRFLMIKALAGYTTTRSGRHVAFAFSINQLPVRLSLYEEKDGYHHAGEVLGEMATAAYLNY
jgi:PBP4 family serine-type D-alanyl-D-alanine carboxypeptidase